MYISICIGVSTSEGRDKIVERMRNRYTRGWFAMISIPMRVYASLTPMHVSRTSARACRLAPIYIARVERENQKERERVDPEIYWTSPATAREWNVREGGEMGFPLPAPSCVIYIHLRLSLRFVVFFLLQYAQRFVRGGDCLVGWGGGLARPQNGPDGLILRWIFLRTFFRWM